MDDAYNNPRNVLEHECDMCWIRYDPENPRKSLKDVIDWHVQISLDPTVSSSAAELIKRGREELMRELFWGKEEKEESNG